MLLALLLIGTALQGQNILVEVAGFGDDQEFPYVGVANNLTIVVEGEMCADLVVKTDNGQIYPSAIEKCLFLYKPVSFGESNITIATIVDLDTVVIEKLQLQAKPLPFTLTIGNLVLDCEHRCRHAIDKAELLSNTFGLETINIDISARTQLVSLEIEVIRNEQQIYHEIIADYSADVIRAIHYELQDLQSGDVVILDKIGHKYFEDFDIVIDSVELLIN